MRIAAIRRFVLPATIVLTLTLGSVGVLHAPSGPAYAASTSGASLCSSQRTQGPAQYTANCSGRDVPGLARHQR